MGPLHVAPCFCAQAVAFELRRDFYLSRRLTNAFEGENVQFRYYLSNDPGTLSPPTDEMLTIEANSLSDAIERINGGNLPKERHPVWLHLLIWGAADDHNRGFESTRLR